MTSYGLAVSPPPYKWALSSFVENRTFKVVLKDGLGQEGHSVWRRSLYGTPQGSVLGPLLWNMFFDPLLEELAEPSQSRHPGTEVLDIAFADDLTLIASAHDPKQAEKELNRKLEIFRNFLKTRGMEAAAHKIKTMCLDQFKRQHQPQILFNGNQVEIVEEHMFLGIIYDKDMSFKNHWKMVITSVISRTKAITMLKSVRWGPTQQTARVLHQSYIESRIRYGMTAWYPYLATTLKYKLEIYLRRSIRAVMGLPNNCWNVALMAEADLDSLEDIAMKSAVALYCMINPTDASQTTLAKKHFLIRKPMWLSMLKNLPTEILDGPLQAKLNKKELIPAYNLTINTKTLNTQAETEVAESACKRLLYTDASVNLTSNPPGEAVIGYLWYDKNPQGEWVMTTQKNISIGYGHSSYTAEAIAISLGLSEIHTPSPNTTIQTNDICGRGCVHPTNENNNPDNAPYEIGIFTDSLSNIDTIRKSIAETKDQQILLKSIAKIKQSMTIHHVRGHKNIKRNIEADKICNIKSQRDDRTTIPGLDGKKTKTKIKSWTKAWASKNRYEKIDKDRQARDRKSATRKWMLEIDPRPKFYNSLARRKGILLAKARTNRWTACNLYLKMINAIDVESSKCTICNTEDSIRHVIDNCQMHEDDREKMLLKIGHPGKVSDLLSSTDIKVVEELADFLIKAEDERMAVRKQLRISKNSNESNQ